MTTGVDAVNQLYSSAEWIKMLDRSYSHVGISCGCHQSLGTVCEIIWGTDVIDQYSLPYTSLAIPSTGESCSSHATNTLTSFED